MPLFRAFLLFTLALGLTSCESVTGPLADSGDSSVGDTDNAWLAADVAVCHVDEAGDYQRITVVQGAVQNHLGHGDELAGGNVLDAQCQPVVQAPACGCFTADDLRSPVAGATPTPYVYLDVFNYYDQDPRRTEVRSTLSTDAGLFEEVAAVYITPTGNGEAPLAPLCFYQDVAPDEFDGEPVYTYTTRALSIREAEACRLELDAFADGQQSCEGAACDLPYTEEQLDPDYPLYHDGGYRTPDPVLDAIQARIEAVRARLAPPA